MDNDCSRTIAYSLTELSFGRYDCHDTITLKEINIFERLLIQKPFFLKIKKVLKICQYTQFEKVFSNFKKGVFNRFSDDSLYSNIKMEYDSLDKVKNKFINWN